MQPYYLLEFRAITCLFEIRVNDTPVFSLTLDNKQFHTTLPINHAIHQPGPVEVSIKILPIPGETQLRSEASLFYEIQLYDVEGANMK